MLHGLGRMTLGCDLARGASAPDQRNADRECADQDCGTRAHGAGVKVKAWSWGFPAVALPATISIRPVRDAAQADRRSPVGVKTLALQLRLLAGGREWAMRVSATSTCSHRAGGDNIRAKDVGGPGCAPDDANSDLLPLCTCRP